MAEAGKKGPRLELAVTSSIVVIAFLCLGGGIGLYLWAIRAPRARYVNSMNVIAWLLIGLFPTLIIFSFFPDSSAAGEFVGIGLSGAVAAFAAIFVLGGRAGAQAIARDQRFDELKAENDRLKAWGSQPAQYDDAKRPLRQQRDLRYRIRGKRGTELKILTGELVDVKHVDAWVSSENTNMQMARYYDRSISSVVRYLGARKNDGGHPVDDVIANELRECMLKLGTLTVEPTTVIATGAGELERTHGVKRVYHVAAVRGEVGVGYTPVGNIRECVTQALARLDAEREAEHDCRTILFPLLGMGTARANPAIVYELISSAVQYVRHHSNSRVKAIYFLARYHEDLRLCVDAADSSDALDRLGGSAEALL